MTFDEYNTDEYFNNKDSTADGLVKAAFDEGKTREEVEASLSPLWKEDKKGNVKKALDSYYKVEEPKEEEKPEVEEMTQTTEALKSDETAPIKKRDKEFLEDTNAIPDNQEKKELDKIIDYRAKDWDNTVDNMKEQGKAFKSIDDHFTDQLPTFLFKRYTSGEFGDPKGKDAKLRLAYFIMNGLQTQMQRISNGAALAAGKAPLYPNATSAYEQYQNTNLAKGMENRWKKYEAETDAAIKLATNRGMKEEDAYDTVKAISRNQRLQTAFNMMNEKQKVYLMNVTKEIGDKIGSFDNKELIDFLTGAAVSGDKLTWQEAAAIAVARFGPDAVKNLKEGKGKIDGNNVTAGFGGKGKNSATLKDGTKIDPGITMNDEEYKKLADAATNLRQQYYDGKLTADEFRAEYGKLEEVMKAHPIKGITSNIKSADKNIQEVNNLKLNELDDSFEELNKNAASGSYKDYLEEYGNLISNAKKWGASEKMIKSLEKKKLTEDKYNKTVQKANKKK